MDLPVELVYLPLGEEALPLLKRGVLPVRPVQSVNLPWLKLAGKPMQEAAGVGVSEDEYLKHLQQEYNRLPSNLQGLFSLEEFVRQAELKRAEIEQALAQQRQETLQQDLGSAEDWLLQELVSDPFSALSWSKSGWHKLWLGIDPQAWPEARIEPVRYQTQLPQDYPARLLIDAPSNEVMQEHRLLAEKSEIEHWVTLGKQRTALIKIPSKAVACILLGALVKESFAQQFKAFWQQDLRYKQKKIATMELQPHQSVWHFIEERK